MGQKGATVYISEKLSALAFQKYQNHYQRCYRPRGGTYILRGRGLGLHIKFGGKIWGKVQPSSPNKRKNLGNSVTTRHKSWEKILILGSNLKFRGQNLGPRQEFQRQILGPSPLPRLPNMGVPPLGLQVKGA